MLTHLEYIQQMQRAADQAAAVDPRLQAIDLRIADAQRRRREAILRVSRLVQS